MPADLIGARYQLHRELARTPRLAVYEAEDRRVGTPTGIAVALGGGQGCVMDEGCWAGAWPGRSTPMSSRRMTAARTATGPLWRFDSTPNPGHRVGHCAVSAEPGRPMGIDLSSALAVLHRAGIRLGGLHPGHVGFDADGAVRLSPWPLAAPPGGWGGHRAWSPPEIIAGAPVRCRGCLVARRGAVEFVGGERSWSALGGGHRGAGRSPPSRCPPGLVDAIGRSMVPTRRAGSLGPPYGVRAARRDGYPPAIDRRRGTPTGGRNPQAGRGLGRGRRRAVGHHRGRRSQLAGRTIGPAAGERTTAPLAPAPPAATGHPAAARRLRRRIGVGPNGVVAMSAMPPSTTAVTGRPGTSGPPPGRPPRRRAARFAGGGGEPAADDDPSASTTPTTTAPTTTSAPPRLRPRPPPPPRDADHHLEPPDLDGHHGPRPSGSGSPINATHDHGGGGGGGRPGD